MFLGRWGIFNAQPLVLNEQRQAGAAIEGVVRHEEIEIAQLAAGDMVVYRAGFPAIYGRQPLYFEDETFAARAAIPPPKRSDSLSSLPVPQIQIL